MPVRDPFAGARRRVQAEEAEGGPAPSAALDDAPAPAGATPGTSPAAVGEVAGWMAPGIDWSTARSDTFPGYMVSFMNMGVQDAPLRPPAIVDLPAASPQPRRGRPARLPLFSLEKRWPTSVRMSEEAWARVGLAVTRLRACPVFEGYSVDRSDVIRLLIEHFTGVLEETAGWRTPDLEWLEAERQRAIAESRPGRGRPRRRTHTLSWKQERVERARAELARAEELLAEEVGNAGEGVLAAGDGGDGRDYDGGDGGPGRAS